jgi:hypothetical protein
MPRYEKIRNRRLFVKPEKSGSKVSSIVNSPLFLWCLTAIGAAVVGQFFTTQQKCWTESEALRGLSYSLATEFQHRQSFYEKLVRSSGSPTEILQKARDYNVSIREFDKKTLDDLAVQGFQVRDRLEEEDAFKYSKWLTFYLFTTKDARFYRMEENTPPDSDKFKKLVDRDGLDELKPRPLYVMPKCAPLDILSQMWRGTNKVIQLLPSYD